MAGRTFAQQPGRLVSPTEPLRAEACKTTRVKVQREPVESISAVTLHTADMAAAVAFYNALGFHLLYGGADAPFTSFRVGSGYLNLQLDPGGTLEKAIWGRIVLWVDDVDAMYERALTAGYRPDSSPADAPWGERYFCIHDPSGHELSFARPLTG
jgi:catechol 2,3-dioxygenase-like lactoylglutathione lyase family enzyme